jgi:hypothetical protein
MAALAVAVEAGAQGIVKCAPLPQATLDANKQGSSTSSSRDGR